MVAAVAGGYVWWEMHIGGKWYKVTLDGEPAGYMHVVEAYERYGGRKVLVETGEQHRYYGGDMVFSYQYQIRRELDGQLITVKTTSNMAVAAGGGTGKRESSAVVADGMFSVTTTDERGQRNGKCELPKDKKVYAMVDAWLLKQHGIGPDDEAEFHVWSYEATGHYKVIVKKVGRVKYVHEGEELDAYRVVVVYEGRWARTTC